MSRILVGNKNEDESKKVVSTDEARNLANSYNIELVETSAKDDINVEDLFVKITKSMLEQVDKKAKENDTTNHNSIKLKKTSRRNNVMSRLKLC